MSLYQHVPTPFREFAGRADAVDEIARAVARHQTGKASGRSANPIIASVGSMGAGKTELLQSLPAALAVHDLSKAWMQNAVPILITFNDSTPRSVDPETDVVDAAARRMLYVYVGAVGQLAAARCACSCCACCAVISQMMLWILKISARGLTAAP